MDKNLFLITGVMLCLGIFLTSCGSSSGQGEVLETAPKEGYLAPDFTLASLDGSSVTLSSLRGKAVFLNFWKVNCSYCLYEMRNIQNMYETYADRDLVVYGINIGDSQEDVENYLQAHHLSFPMLLDIDEAVLETYLVLGIPHSVFIDEDGIIRSIYMGEMSKEVMEDQVKQVVK